jgi:hypothetical protein
MQALRTVSVGLVLFAGLLSGCGQRTLPQEQTYPVRGRVLYKGKPARYVLVRFEPAGKGVEAIGRTGNDGIFELRTFSNEGNDGAVPGEYKVTVEEIDPVQVTKAPKGAKPTPIPNGSITAKKTCGIAAEDNDVTIEIP